MSKAVGKSMDKTKNKTQLNKSFSILRTYYGNDPYEALQSHFNQKVIPFPEYVSLMQQSLSSPTTNFRLNSNTNELWSTKFENSFSIETTPREEILKEQLQGEYWLISDSELLAEATANGMFNSKMAIPFVMEYYKNNDWNKLKEMIRSWETIVDIERLKVFESAVACTSESKSNIHLLTVPSLIGQIEGLHKELQLAIPSETLKSAEARLRRRKPKNIHKKELEKRVTEESVWELMNESGLTWLLEYAIHEAFFRNSKEIQINEEYSLFRHKIMHGEKEYIRFCNEESFFRLFLYADFIITLTSEIRSKSETE